MNLTPERSLIGFWTGTYGTPGNERPMHLFLPADQVDKLPMRGRIETLETGNQQARVAVMDDGAIKIVLEGYDSLVCFSAVLVDGCVRGRRMAMGKHHSVPMAQHEPFVLRHVPAAQVPLGTMTVLEHHEADALGDSTPDCTIHPYSSGLWRGFFDDGNDRVSMGVQFEFVRQLIRGTSEDARGQCCRLEGIRLPASGEVCWIAESQRDGRRWHWVGRPVDGGLEGEWWVAGPDGEDEVSPSRRFRIVPVRRATASQV